MDTENGYSFLPSGFLPPIKQIFYCSHEKIERLVEALREVYTPDVLGTQIESENDVLLPPSLSEKSSGLVARDDYPRSPDKEICPSASDTLLNSHPEFIQRKSSSFRAPPIPSIQFTPNQLSVLRADEFERSYAIRWLTGLISRSDEWISQPLLNEDRQSELHRFVEVQQREIVVERASALLAACSGTASAGVLTRTFTFHVRSGSFLEEQIKIQLKDDPVPAQDQAAVGLQTWGCAPILGELIAADTRKFGLDLETRRGKGGSNADLAVLELGSGTGLLAIMIWELLEMQMLRGAGYGNGDHLDERDVTCKVVATDYHTSVLTNLAYNIALNRAYSSQVIRKPACSITSERLDWTDAPTSKASEKYDLVFGADIVYEPEHAGLIRGVVERVLRRPGGTAAKPDRNDVGGETAKNRREDRSGVFWLIHPFRPTHTVENASIERIFGIGGAEEDGQVGDGWKLGVVAVETFERRKGIGRGDDVVHYRLLKVEWMREQN